MPPSKHLPHHIANTNGADKNAWQQICGQIGLITPDKPYIQLSGRPGRIFFDEEQRVGAEKLSATLCQNPFVGEEPCRLITGADLSELEKYANSVRAILKLCSEGIFPLLQVNHIFKRLSGKFTLAPKADSPWAVIIDLSDEARSGNLSLQDFVDLNGILLPSLDSSNPIRLEHTKICKCCGDFYQAKGPKAIYCSEKCRSRVRFASSGKGGRVAMHRPDPG